MDTDMKIAVKSAAVVLLLVLSAILPPAECLFGTLLLRQLHTLITKKLNINKSFGRVIVR
jgi:hypothetical protein